MHLDTTRILSPTDCDSPQFSQPVAMHKPNMTSMQLTWKLLSVETQTSDQIHTPQA